MLGLHWVQYTGQMSIQQIVFISVQCLSMSMYENDTNVTEASDQFIKRYYACCQEVEM